MTKDELAHLKIFKRGGLLQWPITNPVTKNLINQNLLAVGEREQRVFAGVRYNCVLVKLTPQGKKLVRDSNKSEWIDGGSGGTNSL